MYRLVLLIAVVAACHTEQVVVGELQEVASLKAIPNRDLDLLFVIDNSSSMTDSQVRLAESFPLMMDVLAQLDDGLPNLHIGVVTSDMGTSGSNGAPPGPDVPGLGGCVGTGDNGQIRTSPAIAGYFISDVDDGAGGRERNYTGELRDVFGEIARVGDVGCGFEQHLAAMRASFYHPLNAGFVRPEANLAVVIIADEDDCSVSDPAFFDPESATLGPRDSFRCTRQGIVCDEDVGEVGMKSNCRPRTDGLVEDVQPFVDFLLGVKGDPRMIMVAGIVGDPEPVTVEEREVLGPSLAPSCTFEGANGPEVAGPAVRLAAFLDAFPGRSTLTSICSTDLDAPLIEIGSTAKRLMGDPCLDTTNLVDASPDPGVQPACEVLDIRDSSPDAPSSLPSCDEASTDCYELVSDPVACPATSDHLRLRFRRSTVTEDTWTSVRCQTRS